MPSESCERGDSSPSRNGPSAFEKKQINAMEPEAIEAWSLVRKLKKEAFSTFLKDRMSKIGVIKKG